MLNHLGLKEPKSKERSLKFKQSKKAIQYILIFVTLSFFFKLCCCFCCLRKLIKTRYSERKNIFTKLNWHLHNDEPRAGWWKVLSHFFNDSKVMTGENSPGKLITSRGAFCKKHASKEASPSCTDKKNPIAYYVVYFAISFGPMISNLGGIFMR